jgi:hypothetical protein
MAAGGLLSQSIYCTYVRHLPESFMAILTTVLAFLGAYRLLPKLLRSAVETTVDAWLEAVLQSAGGEILDAVRTAPEIRRVREKLARAVALTLARYPEAHAVVFASDLSKPPFSDAVTQVLRSPQDPLDVVKVREVFANSIYVPEQLRIDPVNLLSEIRSQFLELLRQDERTRSLWSSVVLDRVAGDTSVIRLAVADIQQATTALVQATAEERVASPFLSPDVFFRPWLKPGRLFHHAWSLVGRGDELSRLRDFLDSSDQVVAILPGRGGIGKSRVVLAFSTELSETHPDWQVRIVANEASIQSDDITALPDAATLIVVDDAQRREDLGVILTAARHRSQPTKILLSLRPYGSDHIRSSAVRAGFDIREILSLPELRELSRESAIELAREALGPEYSDNAEALAEITRDSPLVTVIGGKLIAERAVGPRLLAHHTEFKDAVLARLADEYAEALRSRMAAQLPERMLQLLAATAPVRTTNKAFLERAAEFLEINTDEVVQGLGILEAAGILLRRGGTVRITPDVLADYLLYRACVTPAGDSTGFAERVFQTFGAVVPEKVLRNLAELDWQVRLSHGRQTDLLAEVWSNLESEFQGAPHSSRHAILNMMREVAVYQPSRVLSLIEYAIRNPATAPDANPYEAIYSYSHADVLAAIPPLLRKIAYHPDFVPRVCDLLWELGRDDSRELNPNPEHAIRVLADIASYETGNLLVGRGVLAAIRRWIEAPDAHDHLYSPLLIIDPMLEKAGSHTYSIGHELSFRPYLVDPTVTRELREGALQIVKQCAFSERLNVVLRAMQSFSTALRDPQPHFGGSVPDGVLERWVPEQLWILDIMRELVEQDSDPLVYLAVLQAVGWHAAYSSMDSVRESARGVVDAIRQSFEFRFTKMLTSAQYHIDWLLIKLNQTESELSDEEELAHEDSSREQELRETCDEFIVRYAKASDGGAVLSERLRTARDAGESVNPGNFLYVLARSHPEYASELCEFSIRDPDGPLAPHISSLITGFRDRLPDFAFELLTRALDAGSAPLAGAVANVLRSMFWDGTIESRYIALLQRVLAVNDDWVRKLGLYALGALIGKQTDTALEIALSLDLGANSHLTDELFQALAQGHREDNFEHITDEMLQRLLIKLENVSDIGGWATIGFLKHASTRAPRDVVRLLLDRIRKGDETDDVKYRSLPFHLEKSLSGFGKAPDQADILRDIRNRVLEGDGVSFWMAELYAIISLSYDGTGRMVLQEWINSGDPRKIIAAAQLLADAPSTFVLDNDEFTSNLLERASAAGAETYEEVRGGLYARAVSRGGSGIAGEPLPHDVYAQDKASEIASKLIPGSPARQFYEAVAEDARRDIRRTMEQNEEME